MSPMTPEERRERIADLRVGVERAANEAWRDGQHDLQGLALYLVEVLDLLAEDVPTPSVGSPEGA